VRPEAVEQRKQRPNELIGHPNALGANPRNPFLSLFKSALGLAVDPGSGREIA
jgi:hypothetical protein